MKHRLTLLFPIMFVLVAVSVRAGSLGTARVKANKGETTRVSVSSSGAEGNADSLYASLSADGRFIAFASFASNLVPGDTNDTMDIFVHDRHNGTTSRVSIASSGAQANSASSIQESAISADGRFVAFVSWATNLVQGDTNSVSDIFVHDRQSGSTSRVSVDSSGVQGNDDSNYPAISADGRFIAFESWATNFIPGDNNYGPDIFVHDRQSGTTSRVSINSSGEPGTFDSYRPAITADGRFVAFESLSYNLVPGDANTSKDVFVHDRQSGKTSRVSVDSSGAQANEESAWPAISDDGRLVAFESSASNLVPGDTNEMLDVFVHDRQTGITTRVSVGSTGAQGNDFSGVPAISADGRFVTFLSAASNLALVDSNDASDIFIYDRQNGTTSLVSINPSASPENLGSAGPEISADGRFVAFYSYGSDLVTGDTNGVADVFVYDTTPMDPDLNVYLPAIHAR